MSTTLNRVSVGAPFEGQRLAAVYDGFFECVDIEYGGRLFMHLTHAQQTSMQEAAQGYVESVSHLLTDAYGYTEERATALREKALATIQRDLNDSRQWEAQNAH